MFFAYFVRIRYFGYENIFEEFGIIDLTRCLLHQYSTKYAKMLKRLKSLFVVEVPEKNDKPQHKAPSPKTPAPPAVMESQKGEPGHINDRFLEVLFKAMEKHNLDGFDYLEFKQSLQSLKKMEMDEATRFKSAFAMAQTMGADSAHLIKTAKHYLEVLAKEEQQFEGALAKQWEQRVNTKYNEIEKLNQLIAEKEAQVKKLQKEMDEHQKQVTSLNTVINEASQKIETTKNDFIASYNALVSQIYEDLENIKLHLGNDSK